VPSLHFGFATLIAITLWHTWPRWTRPLLVGYPILMGFTLVTTGEHYVSDLLLGAVYAFIAHFAWNRIERWWEHRNPPASPSEPNLSPQYEEPPLV
jgi:membrane-associated phospholipid phosphatase